MDLEVIDDVEQGVEEPLLLAVRWWEKRRFWFNIAVGICGVISLLLFARGFVLADLIGIIFYAIIANVFYSTGFALEAIGLYYLKDKYNFAKYRSTLFSIGLIVSCLITFFGGLFFYWMI